MNVSKLFTRASRYIFLPLSIVSSFSLVFPSSSMAYEIYGPEIRYRSCAQLQKRMNDNNPDKILKGFERAEMVRKNFAEEMRTVYCNGGIIINRANGTVCRGYIAYGYSPESGTAAYFGDWGWLDGSPNNGQTDKDRYCRRLK
jgi:hypothetical protein